jgi:acyl-CoA thioesterase
MSNIATAIINQMMEKDTYSRWLGIERVEEREGYCKLRMTVNEHMCNGFDIAHGSITYGLCDSCLAFASNSRGRQAVSVETSIAHIAPVKVGDVITAESSEESFTNRFCIYSATVFNQLGEKVALFKGVYYRSEKEWSID